MKTFRLISNNSFVKQKINLYRLFCLQSNDQSERLQVEFKCGLPHFLIPLPSRRESCLFILKPITDVVGNLIEAIKEEDYGVDRVAIYSKDGQKISKSNSLYALLLNDFDLVINDTKYNVSCNIPELNLQENIYKVNEIKNLITQLSIAVNTDEFNLNREQDLKKKAETIQKELEPLELQRTQLAEKAALHTRRCTWLGLGAMGLQFGLLARLTWWEYSWDIMEPVTYFVGYGTAITMYAYYVVTRQEYCFPAVFNREYLKKFYSISNKTNFDIDRYNKLRDNLSQVESDIKRLRDPLLLNLPLQQGSNKLES